MKRLLIVYATREGQTAKIAERIAAHVESAGASVTVIDAASHVDADPGEFDFLVFGASMHAGGLERELVDYVRHHARTISGKRRSFFLVLLSAATRDRDMREASLADARRKADSQLAVSFDDFEMIAGALAYSKYPLPLKWLMRRISRKSGGDTDTSRDYEYTDWAQVERYAERLTKT